jgi:hypothetical protein
MLTELPVSIPRSLDSESGSLNSASGSSGPVSDSLDDLESRIVGLAGRLSAATCRWLLLVAEFDAREGYARWCLPSTARWLSHTCGLSARTGIEHVRVARALAAFPALADAMASGRLSYSQVRAISRAVRPGEEATLIDLIDAAKHSSIGQLETVVRGLRTVDDLADADTGAVAEDYLTHGWTSNSQWRMSTRIDPERGEVVRSALETVARAEGISQSQALVRMAEIVLASYRDGAEPPRSLRGDERAAAVIHIDATVVRPENDNARSRERGRPWARVGGGPGLPDSVARRLLCAGRIRTVVHSGAGAHRRAGNVIDLGRSHRVVSDRLYRALLIRDDNECRHPGCCATRGLDAHHVRHWIDGGSTDADNLILLCEAHHQAHHAGEFAIVALGDGAFRFLRPDGTQLPYNIDPGALIDSPAHLETEYPNVAVDAATPRWDGTRINRDFAVAAFAESRSHERRHAC